MSLVGGQKVFFPKKSTRSYDVLFGLYKIQSSLKAEPIFPKPKLSTFLGLTFLMFFRK